MEGGWASRVLPPEQLHLQGDADLGAALVAFHCWQAAHWPRLRQANKELSRGVWSRAMTLHGRRFLVQWNPTRQVSTTAQVDAHSIARRPCFLCPANLPPEERAFSLGTSLLALANPAPILPQHLVLVHREHRPQRILPVLGEFLALPLATAGRFCVFYNGPRCGASAPDHLHLQAARAGLLPAELATRSALNKGELPGETLLVEPHLRAWSVGQAPVLLGLEGDPAAVAAAIQATVALLGARDPAAQEPGLNLLAFGWRRSLVALLFPRRAHRPACFFGPTPRCVVSPGAIDMAGLLITVRRQDFAYLDQSLLAEIYRETSWPAATWLQLQPALQERLNHV